MNTINIKLTQANGNTREVQYEIEIDSHSLFTRLREIAWAASPYSVASAKRAESPCISGCMRSGPHPGACPTEA